MKEYLKRSISASLVLLPFFGYAYWRGTQDGVEHYKRSMNFIMTLDSEYRYGFEDGYRYCKEGK